MGIDLSKVAPEDLDEVQRLLQNVAEEYKYNKRLQVALDRMYPWQKKAIANTATHKVTGVICGNQMGKSEVACAILACHLTGYYPDWWKGKKYDRPVKVMAAGVDSNHNKNVLQERLFGTNNKKMVDEIGTGMIPKDAIITRGIVTDRGDEIKSAKFNHKSGGMSELIFRAYSQGREAAQGFPADIIMIDEQPNDEFWREALTRTKATKGHVICTFTPLEGTSHLIDNLLSLPAEEDSDEDQFGAKYRSDDRWSMIRASWYDAAHIIEDDPNAVEEAKREYSYDYEARVFGMPVVGAGRIYPHSFDKMVYDPEHTLICESWNHIVGVDFGWTTADPSAILLIAHDEANDVIYIREEWKGHTPTDRDFVKQVNFIDPYVPVAWPRDGSKASDWKGGGSIALKLREMGLNMLSDPFFNPVGPDGQRNNHLTPGFQEINSRIQSNRLKISSECMGLLREIENYGYGKDMHGRPTGKPDSKCVDHLCDAFRYGVMTIIQGLGQPMNQVSPWDDEEDTSFFHQTY